MEVNTVSEILTLCYTLAEVNTEMLIYTLGYKLPVVEEEKVRITPAKVECKAVVHTLAAGENEVKDRNFATHYRAKGMEMFDT